MAPLFAEDAVACCFTPGFGIQARYEGKTKVAMFYTSASISEKRATGLAVKVEGDKAEVTGQHDYQVDFPRGGRKLDRSYSSAWRLRKEPDGAWRIYEIAVQLR